MAMLEIDGVGKVEVGSEFLALAPDRQAAEVANIAASIKAAKPAAPQGDSTVTLTDTPQAPPEKPTDIVTRGTLLPAGRTRAGDLVPAVPGAIEGPINTIRDILSGKRGVGEISGHEAFELGLLLSPGVPRAGAMTTKEAASVADAAAARRPAGESPAAVSAAPAATVAPSETLAPTIAAESAAARPLAEAAAAPTTAAELKTVSHAYYKQAEDANVIIAQNSYATMANDAFKTAANKGLDPTLTPNSVAALKRITEIADQPVTFQSLDLMRQIASDAQAAKAPSDRRVAGIIVDKIDDFIAKMTTKDVVSGDPKVAGEVIVKARELWSKASKLDQVDRLVERAKDSAAGFSSSGFENALRTEFRSLAKNDGAMRKYTPEERDAIRAVARGNVAVRNVGKLAPTGIVSAGMSGGIGASIGSLVGMPVAGAVAAGMVGYSARHLATVLTRRNVEALEKTILHGGDSAMAQASLKRGRALLSTLQGPAGVGAEQTIADKRRK